MNYLSRIISSWVSAGAAWLGQVTGVVPTPEDEAAAVAFLVGITLSIYGVVHPWVEERLPLPGKKEG